MDFRTGLIVTANRLRDTTKTINTSPNPETSEYWRGYRNAAREAADALYDLSTEITSTRPAQGGEVTR